MQAIAIKEIKTGAINDGELDKKNKKNFDS